MKNKQIYLTIDDGPGKDFTDKIDYLYHNKIPAILFCQGLLIKKRSEDVKRAIKSGYVIGNHSYDHKSFSKLKITEVYKQISRTDKIINNVYASLGIKRPIKLFRFPFGDRGGVNEVNIIKYLKKLGYKQPEYENLSKSYSVYSNNADCYYSFDTEDWSLDNAKCKDKQYTKLITKINRRLDDKKGTGREIMLIHDHDKTTKYFYKIIKNLQKKGVKFILPKFR